MSTMPVDEFAMTVEQVEEHEFRVRFDHPRFEEPAPIGHDRAPNAARLLSKVRSQVLRNDRGRLRIGKIEVRIDPRIPDSEKPKALRCLDLFEDYCVVTGSVRQGIAVQVAVEGMDHGTGDRKSAHEPGGSGL